MIHPIDAFNTAHTRLAVAVSYKWIGEINTLTMIIPVIMDDDKIPLNVMLTLRGIHQAYSFMGIAAKQMDGEISL